MKILILGGYGTFGGRLAYLLADDKRLTLLIAGRSKQKADAFCKQLPAGAEKIPLFFDRNENVEAQIKDINPNLAVDATGPFQSYGEDPYRVVKACIANNVDYMDLADGSDFVKNISQFDEQSKAKNIFVLSGVSSFPVLSASVMRRLSKGLIQINTIKAGIAPSPYAGVGLNVIRAITTYAGKRLPLIRNKQKSFGYALTETMRYTICPPGHLPLNNTLFSLVDVPDLQVLPELWPELDSIWVGAGPVPEVLHRMLIGLAWLVRIKLLPSLLPFASLFHFVINILRWGEHRGGMFVLIEGLDGNGKKIERSWHLIAAGNDGPFIPSMAVEAIVRRSLSGKKPASGARPATQDLELEDYETIFRTRTIYTGQREWREDTNQELLYRRLLGDAWESLPEPLIKLHSCKKAEGLAKVEVGKNLLSRLIAKLFGFPEAGQDIPVQVSFQQKDGGELWQRTFAGKSFSSFQSEGHGLSERLLSERFGLITFGMALVVESGKKLSLIIRRWSIFGVSLPLVLAPTGDSFEHVVDGRFCFNVEIKYPIIGLIVRYQGWLVPKE
ncbi:MAG: DUF4166 domain-containing protein [Anaerolineales bacterium]|nr:DUF4166 domain-containing protein [Anaerolineales bacterium]